MIGGNKVNKVVKNILLTLFIFSVGFIIAILLVNSLSENAVTSILNQDLVGTNTLNLWGIDILVYQSYHASGQLMIKIINLPIYRYVPFICGILLVIIAWLMSFVTNKFIKKRVGQR